MVKRLLQRGQLVRALVPEQGLSFVREQLWRAQQLDSEPAVDSERRAELSTRQFDTVSMRNLARAAARALPVGRN